MFFTLYLKLLLNLKILMASIDSLLTKIKSAPRLDFGTIFSEAIDLFKKTWLYGLLYYFIIMIVTIPVSMMTNPSIFLMIRNLDRSEVWADQSAMGGLLVGPFFLMSMLGSFVSASLSILLLAGFLRIVRSLDFGQEPNGSDLFYFFKSDYIFKAMIMTLGIMIISAIALVLCILPIVYVAIGVSFCSYFFAFHPELNLGDIFKAAFALGHKKWWLTFGLVIVASILATTVGLLMCVVGLLITASFSVLPTYLIYKHVVGFDENNINKDHLIS